MSVEITPTWKGRPLSEHTKEELIEIIAHLSGMQAKRDAHHEKYKNFIGETFTNMDRNSTS
jgi:hypothetical protein